MWSGFVFELVIWLQEVTLARWTQPSGPLCLWQCFYSNAHTCFLAHFSWAVWDFPNSAQFLLWKGSDIHNIRYILLITRQTYISPSFWVPHSALQEDTSPWHPTIWMSLPALREVQCVMQYFQFLQWYFTFLFVCHTVLLYYVHQTQCTSTTNPVRTVVWRQTLSQEESDH